LVQLQSDPVIHDPSLQHGQESDKYLSTKRRRFEFETTANPSNLHISISPYLSLGRRTYQSKKNDPRSQYHSCTDKTLCIPNGLILRFESMEYFLLGLERWFSLSRGEVVPLPRDWAEDGRRERELTEGVGEWGIGRRESGEEEGEGELTMGG